MQAYNVVSEPFINIDDDITISNTNNQDNNNNIDNSSSSDNNNNNQDNNNNTNALNSNKSDRYEGRKDKETTSTKESEKKLENESDCDSDKVDEKQTIYWNDGPQARELIRCGNIARAMYPRNGMSSQSKIRIITGVNWEQYIKCERVNREMKDGSTQQQQQQHQLQNKEEQGLFQQSKRNILIEKMASIFLKNNIKPQRLIEILEAWKSTSSCSLLDLLSPDKTSKTLLYFEMDGKIWKSKSSRKRRRLHMRSIGPIENHDSGASTSDDGDGDGDGEDYNNNDNKDVKNTFNINDIDGDSDGNNINNDNVIIKITTNLTLSCEYFNPTSDNDVGIVDSEDKNEITNNNNNSGDIIVIDDDDGGTNNSCDSSNDNDHKFICKPCINTTESNVMHVNGVLCRINDNDNNVNTITNTSENDQMRKMIIQLSTLFQYFDQNIPILYLGNIMVICVDSDLIIHFQSLNWRNEFELRFRYDSHVDHVERTLYSWKDGVPHQESIDKESKV
jgi:hypothetical protein